MNIFKMLFALVAMPMFFSSCASFVYQVYEVKSPDMKQESNSMVFENEDCKILYNLWERNGSMAFIFENKTDNDIFIDMTQSFFIKNRAAYNYFNNITYSSSNFTSLDYAHSTTISYKDDTGYWPSRYIRTNAIETKGVAGFSKSVSVKEFEIVCIPAKSYKAFDYYKINPTYINLCNSKLDYPKEKAIIKTYTQNDTPLEFKNRITYSFQKENGQLKHIENSFWLTKITNYSEKAAIKKEKVQSGCSKSIYQTVSLFKIGGPNQFYNSVMLK